MKCARKSMRQYPPHLRHAATLPWETKDSNFLRMLKKMQTYCILVASHFVIHPQILMFSVFKIASLSPYRLCHCFFTYLHLQSICACNEDNDNDILLSQHDKPQTHRTVREISRETAIHRTSLSRIICKDLRLKCFKRRRAQELTYVNSAARMIVR